MHVVSFAVTRMPVLRAVATSVDGEPLYRMSFGFCSLVLVAPLLALNGDLEVRKAGPLPPLFRDGEDLATLELGGRS